MHRDCPSRQTPAMTRRCSVRLLAAPLLALHRVLPSRAREAVTTPEPGFVALFDGTEASFAQWQVAGLDGFSWEDGVIVTSPVDEDLGLLSYAPRPYADSVLRLQCRITAPDDNSGVFVRCRDPRQSLPEQLLATPDAATSFPNRADYASTGAWVAVDTGFEVQIDEAAAGDPSSLDPHRTGALSDVPVGTGAR